MSEQDPSRAYGWDSAEATCSHAYLLPVIRRLVEGVGAGSGPLRIFDAGCGNGFLAGALSRKGNVVAGCDASLDGIEHARGACPDIRFEVMSAYDDLAGVFGSDWDVVVSTEVLEHLYDPRRFAANLYGLCRPGGTLVVSTPYHGYLKNLALAVAGAMDRHFTALWDDGHIKFWSYATLKTLLSEAGFRDFSFHGAGRLPWLWKSMVVSARKPGEDR